MKNFIQGDKNKINIRNTYIIVPEIRLSQKDQIAILNQIEKLKKEKKKSFACYNLFLTQTSNLAGVAEDIKVLLKANGYDLMEIGTSYGGDVVGVKISWAPDCETKECFDVLVGRE